MRHLLLALILSVVASPVFAANYATCILDKMPGVANDVAANAVRQVCRAEHPTGMDGVVQGSGRGFFGFKSGAECVVKKAGETRSQSAAATIGAACRKLYEESEITRFLNDAPTR